MPPEMNVSRYKSVATSKGIIALKPARANVNLMCRQSISRGLALTNLKSFLYTTQDDANRAKPLV